MASKINRYKRFVATINENEKHRAFVELSESGEFTIGEEYDGVFGAHICVRASVVPELISILANPDNWVFETPQED